MISEIVQKFIERLLIHEARYFNKDVSHIDLIIRRRSDMVVYVYDTVNKCVLRILSAKDIENILNQ